MARAGPRDDLSAKLYPRRTPSAHPSTEYGIRGLRSTYLKRSVVFAPSCSVGRPVAVPLGSRLMVSRRAYGRDADRPRNSITNTMMPYLQASDQGA